MTAAGKNGGYRYVERLDSLAEGRTVLSHLTSRYHHSSEDEWRERIESGHVLLDGVVPHAEKPLRKGGTLVWNRPPWREPAAPRSFAILFRDRDVLAVAKPAGLPTMPGGGYLENTLLHLVSRSHPGASPLHRLGRGTSGIVLFTRNRTARRILSAAWSMGRVERRYRGLVVGRFPEGEIVLEYPIGPIPHHLLGSVEAVSKEGKSSRTHVRLLEVREQSSLVDIEIETGRTHQIRIHLAASGHPLVGEPLYPKGGRFHPETDALPGDIGYRLHAYRLGFDHPRTARRIVVSCGPPPSYRARHE